MEPQVWDGSHCNTEWVFFARFASVTAYEHAKLEGPWTVLDHCLAAKD